MQHALGSLAVWQVHMAELASTDVTSHDRMQPVTTLCYQS